MKVILYALGRVFEEQKKNIDWSQVVALADKNLNLAQKDNNVRMIYPNQICTIDYDYLAIFSNHLFEEIRIELVGAYSVPKEKIIPWNEIVKGERGITSKTFKLYQVFFEENICKKVLDIGMSFLPNYCLVKSQLISKQDAVLDGLWSSGAITNDCLYDSIYEACEDCTENYDVVLLWNEVNAIERKLKNVRNKTRYILWHTGYLWNDLCIRKEMINRLQDYGKVSYISNNEGILWIVDTQKIKYEEDVSIYVAVHKKYNVQSNKLYRPLCVGLFQMEGCLTEQKGENIAYLNSKINECTALYWIWKNADAAYVGLNHYRRYFYNNKIESIDNYLDVSHILAIFREYDIILTEVQSMRDTTVYEQIYNSINHDLCEKGYALMRRGIEKHQPGYLQIFDDVMNGHNIFLCNMFVTRREILNRYCEWLFSFLIEVAEAIDVEGYDSYSQRVIGFFAERMWTIWLRKNQLKIKELPYVNVK